MLSSIPIVALLLALATAAPTVLNSTTISGPTCEPQACGGFANTQCPTGATCVDDPRDSCDPLHGGFDCSGICLFPPAQTSDSETLPVEGGQCGGFLGIQCAAGLTCIDDPKDDCDPLHGGSDCQGICVADENPVCRPTACGGFANIPCAAGEVCFEDPLDGCDPAKGGADCGGICLHVPDDGGSGCNSAKR